MAKATKRTAREKDTLDSGRDRATLPRATVTAQRRRRPTSKAIEVETPAEKRQAAASARRKAATGRGSKRALAAKARGRAEDKRESLADVVTDAVPKNAKADKNDKRSKGKSTHDLEARAPGKRPSRKSTRRGANHIKPDAQQRRQTMRAVRSPKSRHASRSA